MALALACTCNLFSQLQHALTTKTKSRVSLNKGVRAFDDFHWLLQDIQLRSTRIAKLVPLLFSVEGHQGVFGKGTSGVWFSSLHLVSRNGVFSELFVWRVW